jgi:hypothetical protein
MQQAGSSLLKGPIASRTESPLENNMIGTRFAPCDVLQSAAIPRVPMLAVGLILIVQAVFE